MVSACPVSITNAGERCPPLFGGVCVSVLSSIPGSNFRAVLSGGREVKGIFAPLSKKYSLFLKYFYKRNIFLACYIPMRKIGTVYGGSYMPSL